MKENKTLIFLLVLVVIAMGVLGWMLFQLKNISSNSSLNENVGSNIINESGYYFDDNYNYNLDKSTTGVLESITDSIITISIGGNSNSYQFNTNVGFLLYCLPASYVLSDGQTVKNIDLGVDYSRADSEAKKQLVQVSKNISLSDKVKYLSENFIGSEIALGLNLVDPSIVETVNVYSDDKSICEKI